MKPSVDEYGQVWDSEPFDVPTGFELLLQCCDCGLVHRTTLKKTKKGIRIWMVRDVKETRKARRAKRR
jgi:uncharacterized Zn finger protein